MPAKSKIAIIVPHTHWDREWRYPLWKNRALLVEFMDELLDTLDADPAYRHFLTDGQVVLIEDYLQVKPEAEGRIRSAVEAGRLGIGPWYTLPDLYPLDGECLLRNLLRGTRVCEKLGGWVKVGYHSFGWGQTAQFPQIYAGFGIEFLIAAKRVNPDRAPHCEFLWRGPDGTEILTSRLGEHGRANLFMNAYMAVRCGVDYFSRDFQYPWGRPFAVMHDATAEGCANDYFRSAGSAEYHKDRLKPAFETAWKAYDETTVADVRLIMDGCDFSTCQPELTRMLADANEAFDDIEWVHGSLEQYAAELHARVDRAALPLVTGEMRDGPASSCSANALATRMYIKLLNKRAEDLLLRRVEPLAALLAMRGAAYPTRMLEIAWTHLLQSHPHDSINGVTQDQTAEDTCNRIQQAVQIGRAVGEESVKELLGRIDASAFAADDILLLAVNPLPRPVRAVRKLCVDIPQDRDVWTFSLEDAAGNEFDVQPISRQERNCPVHDLYARPWPFHHDRHMVYADLGELPAGGYKLFRVKPTGTFNRAAEWWPQMRTSDGRELSPAPNVLENGRLRAEFAPDGTLTLTDKASGTSHAGLHYFVDGGDVGDYWAFYPPYTDEIHDSRSCPGRIWLEDNGPLSATIIVEKVMTVPAGAEWAWANLRGESRRRSETVELTITSHFTLTRGARRLDVRTVVTNTARDHRLRLMLPTDIRAEGSCASGHFTVDQRPVEPKRADAGEFWPEMQLHPMQHFVDLSDGERGFGVVSSGFTEYEALRDDRRTLALTLFRAVRNRICTEWRATGYFPNQHGGQCLRTMAFEYALVPHTEGWAAAGLYAEAESLKCPPGLYQVSPQGSGEMPAECGMLSVEPANLVVSALKKAEDRETIILRLFNPTGETLAGVIRIDGAKAAWRTDLNETRGEAVDVTDGVIAQDVPPGRIVTLDIES